MIIVDYIKAELLNEVHELIEHVNDCKNATVAADLVCSLNKLDKGLNDLYNLISTEMSALEKDYESATQSCKSTDDFTEGERHLMTIIDRMIMQCAEDPYK